MKEVRKIVLLRITKKEGSDSRIQISKKSDTQRQNIIRKEIR